MASCVARAVEHCLHDMQRVARAYSKTCRLQSSPGGPIAQEPSAADSPSQPKAAPHMRIMHYAAAPGM